MKRTIVLRGGLQLEVKIYSKTARGISIYGNVSCNGQWFKDLPILGLLIEDVSLGNHNDEAMVSDVYCPLIPYLKPIKAFRDLLEEELLNFRGKIDKLSRAGIDEYLKELRTFSEAKSVIREVKTQVNKLRAERVNDIGIARKILEVMSTFPSTDNIFEVAKE